MKKNGFTLAEILVTLAIVGVVSALTVPYLNVNVSQQKIGPMLANFNNEYENAVKTYLLNEGRTQLNQDLSDYNSLSSVWNISNIDENNRIYGLKSGGEFQVIAGDADAGLNHIIYDINGFGKGENYDGDNNGAQSVDQFHFIASRNGHLYPAGSKSLATLGNRITNQRRELARQQFQKKVPGPTIIDSINITTKSDCTQKSKYMAGAIADNGWTTKGLAIYK